MQAFLIAGLMFLLLGSAQAQQPGLIITDDGRHRDPVQEQKREAVDRAYKATTEKITAVKSAVDPWGSVRSNTPAPAKSGQ